MHAHDGLAILAGDFNARTGSAGIPCHSKTVPTPKRVHRSECAEAAQREGRAHGKLLGNIMTNLTVCRMSVIFCGSLSGRCLA